MHRKNAVVMNLLLEHDACIETGKSLYFSLFLFLIVIICLILLLILIFDVIR
jgi:hypothetical protein